VHNEMLRVDRCRDMDELITFESDPGHSPDAGTDCFLPKRIYAYALQRELLLRRTSGNPTYTGIGAPVDAATRGFEA